MGILGAWRGFDIRGRGLLSIFALPPGHVGAHEGSPHRKRGCPEGLCNWNMLKAAKP